VFGYINASLRHSSSAAMPRAPATHWPEISALCGEISALRGQMQRVKGERQA